MGMTWAVAILARYCPPRKRRVDDHALQYMDHVYNACVLTHIHVYNAHVITHIYMCIHIYIYVYIYIYLYTSRSDLFESDWGGRGNPNNNSLDFSAA